MVNGTKMLNVLLITRGQRDNRLKDVALITRGQRDNRLKYGRRDVVKVGSQDVKGIWYQANADAS